MRATPSGPVSILPAPLYPPNRSRERVVSARVSWRNTRFAGVWPSGHVDWRRCPTGSSSILRRVKSGVQVLSNALFTHRTFRSGARSVARQSLDGVGRQLAPGPCARAGPPVNRRGMTSQTDFSPAQALKGPQKPVGARSGRVNRAQTVPTDPHPFTGALIPGTGRDARTPSP
jgi:hypothetical protein